MSKSKEYISTSSDDSDEDKKPKKKTRHVSDEEEEKSRPSKKAKKGPSEKEKEKEDNVWDIGNNRKVTVREYRGKLYVDIREMYFDGEGNLKPGKKGISMTTQQWRTFLSITDEVDKCVKSKS